jgi:hypothetical protein
MKDGIEAKKELLKKSKQNESYFIRKEIKRE